MNTVQHTYLELLRYKAKSVGAMEEEQVGHVAVHQRAGCFPICDLPMDILRIILKKLSLKDRLVLELLNKGHHDIFRDAESWFEISLQDMQALGLTERQMSKLFSRVQPGFERASSQIDSIIAILESFSKSYSGVLHSTRQPSYEDVYSEAQIAYIIRAAGFSYEQSPLETKLERSLGRTRRILEACTVWLAEHLAWLEQMGGFRDLILFLSKAAGFGTKSSPPKEGCLAVDVPGAKSLSPSFLAACMILLSGAGFAIEFRMTGDSDPPFASHHTVDFLQVLTGSNCIFYVNLVLPEGATSGIDLKEALEEYTAPTGKFMLLQYANSATPLVRVLAHAESLVSEKSKALYNNFLSKTLALEYLKNAAVSALGRRVSPFNPEEEGRVVSKTVILEDWFSAADIGRCLRKLPDRSLRLVFQNCDSLWFCGARAGQLLDALGNSSIFHVSFQSPPGPPERILPGLDWREDILGSAALQSSSALQVLELDFRLSVSDLPLVQQFLEQSQPGVQLRVHLRASFYPGLEQLRSVSAGLAELRSNLEWGGRLVVVEYRAANVAREESRVDVTLLLASVQQAAARVRKSQLLKRNLLWIALSFPSALVLIFLVFGAERDQLDMWIDGMRITGKYYIYFSVIGSIQIKFVGEPDIFGILSAGLLAFIPFTSVLSFFTRVGLTLVNYGLICHGIRKLQGLVGASKHSAAEGNPFVAIVDRTRAEFNETGRSPHLKVLSSRKGVGQNQVLK